MTSVIRFSVTERQRTALEYPCARADETMHDRFAAFVPVRWRGGTTVWGTILSVNK